MSALPGTEKSKIFPTPNDLKKKSASRYLPNSQLTTKMSQGTLYTTEQARGIVPKALIKHFNLDVKIADKEDASYKKFFPLNKIPAFVGPKGFKLTEVIAISIYCMYDFFFSRMCQNDEKFFHYYTVIPVLINYVENI